MCIDNIKGKLGLVIGKTYTLIKEDNIGYLVKNECGVSEWVCKERFKIVEEDQDMNKEYTFQEVIANIKPGEVYKATEHIHTINTIRFLENGEILDFPTNSGVNLKVRYIKVQPRIVDFIEAWNTKEKEGKSIKSIISNRVLKKGCFDTIGTDEIEGQWMIIE